MVKDGARSHTITRRDPLPTDVQIDILYCGVCHSDIHIHDGKFDMGKDAPAVELPTQLLPLIMGHEIEGVVEALGPDAARRNPHVKVGDRVAVFPWIGCQECAACKRGRPTSCPAGRMPGNDADGGFATHVMVPAHDLVPLDPPGPARHGLIGEAGLEAWEIAPIADAATTAYQAVVRAGLAEGEVAIFIGAGGVGGRA